MKRYSFKFSFIAFSVAVILTLFAFLPLNKFRINVYYGYAFIGDIIMVNLIGGNGYIFYPNYLHYFFLGFIIISISVLSFLIGLINALLILRSTWWINREGNKNIENSLILISIAFGLNLIAYLKLLIFSFHLQKRHFWESNKTVYTVSSLNFNFNYIQGFIFLIISIIISIVAILLFSLRWKKNIFKIPSIVFSGAIILSIIAFIYLNIFKNQLSKSNHYLNYFYFSNNSKLSNFNLGFILVLVSLISFIIGIILYLWSILLRKKEKKNNFIRKFLQDKERKKTVIFSFILICTTISLILTTYLMFLTFNGYIQRNLYLPTSFNSVLYGMHGNIVNSFGFLYYYRGFLFFTISIIISINAIFLFLSKFSPENSEERVINSEEIQDDIT